MLFFFEKIVRALIKSEFIISVEKIILSMLKTSIELTPITAAILDIPRVVNLGYTYYSHNPALLKTTFWVVHRSKMKLTI